jgi:hypothetical protein
MVFNNNSAKRLRPEDLHVDKAMQPDWTNGNDAPLTAGDLVLCTAGLAKIIKVRGKTGDGSRLLELKLVEGDTHPFYAAASNVLVRPAQADEASQMVG